MTDLPILPEGTGVMLCGHGSRNQRAVGEFAVLADVLRTRLPGVPVEFGYLEFANPVIHLGLDRLREQGVRHVLAVPGMLFAAGHAKNDIPAVLKTYEAAHSGLTITYGRELGVDLKMLRAAGDRIEEGLRTSYVGPQSPAGSPGSPPDRSALVVANSRSGAHTLTGSPTGHLLDLPSVLAK